MPALPDARKRTRCVRAGGSPVRPCGEGGQTQTSAARLSVSAGGRAHLRGDDEGPVPVFREERDDVREDVSAVLHCQRAVLWEEVVLHVAVTAHGNRISRHRRSPLKLAAGGRAERTRSGEHCQMERALWTASMILLLYESYIRDLVSVRASCTRHPIESVASSYRSPAGTEQQEQHGR